MREKREIEIQFYGAFRELIPSGFCTISVTGDETIRQVKEFLQNILGQYQSSVSFDVRSLLLKSALATEAGVLADEDRLSIPADQTSHFVLAVLPPVCGG